MVPSNGNGGDQAVAGRRRYRCLRSAHLTEAATLTLGVGVQRDELTADVEDRREDAAQEGRADDAAQDDREAIQEPDLGHGAEAGDRGQQRSEEHTSELQSLMRISYAVFCLTKKK